MAEGFHHLSLRAADLPDGGLALEFGYRFAMVREVTRPGNQLVARRYLDLACHTEQAGPALRTIAADESPAWVPGLTFHDELSSPFRDNLIVRFRQSYRQVQVQGARATVELTPDQELSHLDVEIADEEELASVREAMPEISPHGAFYALSHLPDGPGLEAQPEARPELVIFRAQERFLLCWRFPDLPRRMPEPDDEDVGGWESARTRPSRADFYVDALSGDFVAAISTSRSLKLPVDCTGDDEDGIQRAFDGSANMGGFEMVDPVRHTSTHDFQLQPYLTNSSPAIPAAVSNSTSDWGNTNPAAVTAHHNAQVVHDFFESVLHRQSVDANQMTLVSVVNCADQHGNQDLLQAYWTDGRILYGQTTVNGRVTSLARYLDVVAHELCHGVTEHTSNLLYTGESGALNESLSDVFGVIVRNRLASQDTSAWDWQIGAGLGRNGAPLRDLRDPGQGSPPQPDHYRRYVYTVHDNGGVHTNSGIHNKAAYLLLTAHKSDGSLLLPPDEIARMYYFVLIQLTDNATFSDCRKKLTETVRTVKQGNSDLAEIESAIDTAYDTVGII